jgi:hypothetical protein
VRKFSATDCRHFDASVVPDVEFIADRITELQGVSLDGGEVMVAADAIRRALVEAAVKTLEEELDASFEPPRTKRSYWRTNIVRRNDPGACSDCGVAMGTSADWVVDNNLSREDFEEHMVERLDRSMHVREDCPACGRPIAFYGAVEVEE